MAKQINDIEDNGFRKEILQENERILRDLRKFVQKLDKLTEEAEKKTNRNRG